MSQHRPIKALIAPEIFNALRSGHLVRLLTVLWLGTLTGCFNRPQTTANAPTPTPTPINSASAPVPLPSSSEIAPTGTPQPSPSVSNGSQSSVTKDIESRLNKAIVGTTGISIQSVTCPAGTGAKAGERFDCSAVSNGQTFAIAVEITNAAGPQFQWSTKGLLVLSKLEQFIEQQVKDKNGISVTADCGGSIRVAKSGEIFECKVSDPQGQSRSAKITVKDEQGNVDVSLM